MPRGKMRSGKALMRKESAGGVSRWCLWWWWGGSAGRKTEATAAVAVQKRLIRATVARPSRVMVTEPATWTPMAAPAQSRRPCWSSVATSAEKVKRWSARQGIR